MASQKRNRAEALKELKHAREGGGRAKQYKADTDTALYDEVDEAKYMSIVRNRLDQDDFVEDDGVSGYTDHGMDIFDEEEHYSEDDAKPKQTKKSSKPRGKPPPEPAPMAAYRKVVSEDQEDDFMKSILSDMDSAPVPSRPNPRKRKNSPDFDDATDYHTYRDHDAVSSDGGDDFGNTDFSAQASSDDDYYGVPTKKFKAANGKSINVIPAAKKMGKLEIDDGPDEYDDEFGAFPEHEMELDGPPIKKEPRVKKELVIKQEPMPVTIPPPKNSTVLKAEPPSWLAVHAALTSAPEETIGGSTSNLPSSKVQALEEDGTLRFFWLDYQEENGVVFLIGKVLDKSTGRYVSASVSIQGIQRNLFVLPRPRRMDGEYETDITPSQMDVFKDVDAVRKQWNIKKWKAKWVRRSYAFGEPGIPTEETEWLKVVYGFDEPSINAEVTSPNILRVFGKGTSAFELFVLKRKIMGTCWLQIKNAVIANNGASWCKIEATVSTPKDVSPFSETDKSQPKDMPPLTIMSVAVRSVVNHVANKREIVCVALRVWENMQIEETTPIETLPCAAHTLVRPLETYPRDFEKFAATNKQTRMQALSGERPLLNSLLVLIQRYDADVILGHDFLGVSLDLLLHRMHEHRVDHWSRISRFKRNAWINIGKQGTNIRFLQGRLLCDLTSDGAKGMISSTTWSLTEMCRSLLKVTRQDIDPEDTASYFDAAISSPTRLMEFVQHCELDTFLQMAIASKVQILPLTRQLTNLAGNSWNKTLNGGRAERNEYILLHEFHKLKYVVPDKTWGKKAAIAAKQDTEEGHEADIAPKDSAGKGTKNKNKNNRDKFKGGLVLEPKRQLYDKIILVMDFNSLYPSIIQEYNIDFTTIQPVPPNEAGEEQIPPVPSPDLEPGVLPRLIAELVNRRKRVKAMLKDKNAPPAKRMQWDIKQMALKLTANSMYGCLGFEYSRFYARPLAALTTFRGREILKETCELAEKHGLEVVYGDTDSVFVNSNQNSVEEALKIAHQFKKEVNGRYRLLEIDVDGVFQRLLLLQKKKYAAIKIEGDKPSMEIKGLDMKRREYCVLSKNASEEVLKCILSGDETEVVIERIHEYLTTIGEAVRGGKIPLEDYIIFKRLSKNPGDYEDVKSQPHAQVGLRMKQRNQSAKAGDVIPYIFCLGEDGAASRTAQADRAYHPDEIRRSNGQLRIDFDFYLAQQILPSIDRLCAPISGTDRARLAEYLGLDPTRFRTYSTTAEELDFAPLGSQLSDEVRFQDCEKFMVTCRKCHAAPLEFAPAGKSTNVFLTPMGLVCPSCEAPLGEGSLEVQLEVQIRKHVARYYEGWLVCDDGVCGCRTRMMRVYGRKCLRPECRGTMSYEYDDLQMYTQLLYFSSLFNTEKTPSAAKGTSGQDAVSPLLNLNSLFLGNMTRLVDKYLIQCGRRWVDLKSLFSFMNV